MHKNWPSYDVTSVRICSSSVVLLPWVKETKYFGVTTVRSRSFKISTEESRRAFHRTANAGCIGRLAKEEVVRQLLCSKCIPILLYGLEASLLRKADLNVLDFVVNMFFIVDARSA